MTLVAFSPENQPSVIIPVVSDDLSRDLYNTSVHFLISRTKRFSRELSYGNNQTSECCLSYMQSLEYEEGRGCDFSSRAPYDYNCSETTLPLSHQASFRHISIDDPFEMQSGQSSMRFSYQNQPHTPPIHSRM